MKRWLILLCVLLAIAAVAASIAGYHLNSKYGWMASSPVYHDSLATPETRLRLAVDTLRLSDDLKAYLPEDIALPVWLPWDVPTLLPRVVPREVAVLGHSDFREGTFDLTLFVNEQRGGPVLPAYLNTRTRFKQMFPAVTWEEPGFVLRERGTLSADGHIEMPEDLESKIRETWSANPPEGELALTGGHLAELAIDNRNGEIVTLIGTLAPIWNTSLERLSQIQQFRETLSLLGKVLDLRAAADFESEDALLLQVRVSAEPDAGAQLETALVIATTVISVEVERNYGLKMDVDTKWNAEESTCVVDIRITGIEEKLTAYFKRAVPAPAPAAPPADETE